MAFFGFTQLGYQDAIREHLKDPGFSPQHLYRSGLYRLVFPGRQLRFKPEYPVCPKFGVERGV